ncbi:putative protein serine/threonine kinase [Blyttiomyces sp. JEL0837]|nr:putative protein serine/threonine kinase [Blyttiomyces sp. JEL0837]
MHVEKLELIGRGSFGQVFRGIDHSTNREIAIKVVDFEDTSDEVDEIMREISILSKLRSPYVTQYYGSFLKEKSLWILMEFCAGGSCLDLLSKGTLSESQIGCVMGQSLSGLNYIHKEGKIHRDIKAANILLTKDGDVKLADFGVSAQVTATITKKNTLVGTPYWMAPEVILRSSYNFKADIWSLGITAIELANGLPPHADLHPMKVLFIIPKSAPPTLPSCFSEEFRDFVASCLVVRPSHRPCANDLLSHPFIKSTCSKETIVELIRSRNSKSDNTRQKGEDENEFVNKNQTEPSKDDKRNEQVIHKLQPHQSLTFPSRQNDRKQQQQHHPHILTPPEESNKRNQKIISNENQISNDEPTTAETRLSKWGATWQSGDVDMKYIRCGGVERDYGKDGNGDKEREGECEGEGEGEREGESIREILLYRWRKRHLQVHVG